ncbi:EG45-like domain containing protein isoform X2 [Nymphaea colorata]|uniref:EG45-like domain containing protein isoform X2 n=1 Tax=Nymphaea colorata TaxID=210225 RepID=UPI00129EDFF5|nr:EG45-like domain containing protein isoform X2 [Nymphaea colorata]
MAPIFFRSSVSLPFLLVAVALCSLPISSADDGIATFYTDTTFACENQDPGTNYAAVGQSMYDNGGICGRQYSVSCTGATNESPNPCRGGSVIVKVVDLCESCEYGHLDISQEAFSTIADLDAGVIKISYQPDGILLSRGVNDFFVCYNLQYNK